MTNFLVVENIWKISESVKCPGKLFFKKLFGFYLGGLFYNKKREAGHTLGCGDGVFDGDVQGTSFG